jgi:hypothetical protein
MDATEARPPTPPLKRRWCQYSLRSLMLFVLCCAIACSWLAVKQQRARRQSGAFAALKKMTDCAFYYDRYGRIMDAKSPGMLLWNCDIWGCPWDLDLGTANPQPGTLERCAGSLFGEHFVRHIVTVGLPPKRIDEVIPLLKQLPDLRTVLVQQTSDNHKADYSDAVVDAAVKAVELGVPGVEVETLHIDLDLSENVQSDLCSNVKLDLPADANLQIGDVCWTADTTEVAVSAALWAGLILDFCHR